MGNITVSDLRIYPIKSTQGRSIKKSSVLFTGLEYDRKMAIVNDNNKIITARENSGLLKISAIISENVLSLYNRSTKIGSIDISDANFEEEDITIFRDQIKGEIIVSELNKKISEVMDQPCRLLKLSSNYKRLIKAKFGGLENDELSFADAAPILMISVESLDDLNSRLRSPVEMNRFRPNIIIRGCKPYEEDTWNKISIGDSEYDISSACGRCIFTTIDPLSLKKDKNQEPLKTLSEYRSDKDGGVKFGVYLIPRKLGEIKIGDHVFTSWCE